MTFFSSSATSTATPASGVSLPEAPEPACSPKPIDASDDSCVQQELDRAIADGDSGESLLLRRTRYVLRFIYWTCKHRSTANARWVCAYEGFTW